MDIALDQAPQVLEAHPQNRRAATLKERSLEARYPVREASLQMLMGDSRMRGQISHAGGELGAAH